jgi:hypothetical protein
LTGNPQLSAKDKLGQWMREVELHAEDVTHRRANAVALK